MSKKKSATFWGKVVLFLHVDNGIEPVFASFKEPIKEQKLRIFRIIRQIEMKY